VVNGTFGIYRFGHFNDKKKAKILFINISYPPEKIENSIRCSLPFVIFLKLIGYIQVFARVNASIFLEEKKIKKQVSIGNCI
jgi:hypothetical protein